MGLMIADIEYDELGKPWRGLRTKGRGIEVPAGVKPQSNGQGRGGRGRVVEVVVEVVAASATEEAISIIISSSGLHSPKRSIISSSELHSPPRSIISSSGFCILRVSSSAAVGFTAPRASPSVS